MDDYALVLNRSKVSVWVIPPNEELIMASWLVTTFMNKLRKYPTYRNA